MKNDLLLSSFIMLDILTKIVHRDSDYDGILGAQEPNKDPGDNSTNAQYTE